VKIYVGVDVWDVLREKSVGSSGKGEDWPVGDATLKDIIPVEKKGRRGKDKKDCETTLETAWVWVPRGRKGEFSAGGGGRYKKKGPAGQIG